MDKIPSVDLRDFLSDNPERKQKFVNEIGKAYEEIGFVALKDTFGRQSGRQSLRRSKKFLRTATRN